MQHIILVFLFSEMKASDPFVTISLFLFVVSLYDPCNLQTKIIFSTLRYAWSILEEIFHFFHKIGLD